MMEGPGRNAAAALGAALLCVACARNPQEPRLQPLPVIVGSEASTARLDPLNVVDARISGDTLHLRVQHGGGCARHDYGVLFSGVFRESEPVQADLRVAHDAHGDRCRALVGADVAFDLAPVRHAWQNAYRQQSGRVQLHVIEPGTAGAARALLYAF